MTSYHWFRSQQSPQMSVPGSDFASSHIVQVPARRSACSRAKRLITVSIALQGAKNAAFRMDPMVHPLTHDSGIAPRGQFLCAGAAA